MIIDYERIDTLSPRYALFKERVTVGISYHRFQCKKAPDLVPKIVP